MTQERIDSIRQQQILDRASGVLGEVNSLLAQRRAADARLALQRADSLFALAVKHEEIAARVREEYQTAGIEDVSDEQVVVGLVEEMDEESLRRVFEQILTRPLVSKVLAGIVQPVAVKPHPFILLEPAPDSVGKGEQNTQDKNDGKDKSSNAQPRAARKTNLIRTMFGLDASRPILDSYEDVMFSVYSDKVDNQAPQGEERQRVSRYYRSVATQAVDEFLDQVDRPETPKFTHHGTRDLIAELKNHPRFSQLTREQRRKVMLREEGWKQIWQPEPVPPKPGNGEGDRRDNAENLVDLSSLQERIIIASLKVRFPNGEVVVEHKTLKDVVCRVYQRQIESARRIGAERLQQEIGILTQDIIREVKDIRQKLEQASKLRKEGKSIPTLLDARLNRFERDRDYSFYNCLTFEELEQFMIRDISEGEAITKIRLRLAARDNSSRIRVRTPSQEEAETILDKIFVAN